ncbi:hypothetical protein U4E84_06150 [Halorubrum sp. AD140]|uniref:hypothetical protein n=1 Tax=Halorubrum sp. AD140 TaxID=3050073 RepID=UPI002ACC694D|nr:hypothetical protein [Halorubrum sp. AD140]MDZ5810924.1 hypothetical protein [Halorubrum sp. AD140]
MTLTLSELTRRVYDQLREATDDIDADRETVDGRSLALTAVDVDVPVGFLAEPPDAVDSANEPTGLAVNVDEGDGLVSLSFRPRPPPEKTGDDGSSRRERGLNRLGSPERRPGAASRAGSEGAERRATEPSGSTVDDLRSLGTDPTTARLLAARDIGVAELADLSEAEVYDELQTAIQHAPNVSSEWYEPDIRRLSRLIANASERSS